MLTVLLASAAGAEAPSAPAAPTSVHSFTVKTIEGADKSLADYKGKVLLIVNTASRCGFTPQYEGLEELYQRYHERGFEVLAFPSNDFMGQEPGTSAEIKTFCTTKYKTTFPLFEKIHTKGDQIHPLYAYMTTQAGHDGSISWNFNKILVDKDGKVIARFGSTTKPTSKDITAKLDELLPAAK